MIRKPAGWRRLVAGVVVGSLAVVAAACGDDDEDSDDASATTAAPVQTTAAAPDTSPDTTAASETSAAPETSAAAPDTTSGEPKEPLEIGVIIDQSGPQAAGNARNLEGIELAIDKINAEGLAGGHPLELVVADDGSEAARSVSAAIKLIEEDDVAAILGPMLSGGALAVIEHMNTNEVFRPMIGTSGDPAILHGEDATRKWYFNSSLDTQLFATEAVDVLVAEHSPATMGSIFTTVVSAESAANVSRDHAEELGIGWVGSEGVALDQTDLLAAARTLQDAGAESVVIWAVTPAAVLGWLRAREQLSWDVPWVIADVTLSAHYESVPELIEGALVGSMCDPRIDGFQEMAAAYQEKHGEELPVAAYDNVGAMYNATLVLADAISRATDPTDPASIRDAIEETSGLESACQIPLEIELSPEDHVVAGGYPFFRFTGGERVYLEGE
jgi:branched-chain amino acid transport system substrate-binding protein